MNDMSPIPREQFLWDGEGGTRYVDRRIFSCPKLYEQEFTHIWEKVWVYLAHESQIKNPRDYITGWIGRVPVIVNRNDSGQLNCLVNICTHRGATLCRMSKGSTRDFTCPFHGWSFDLDGNLAAPMAEAGAGYPPGFDKSRLGLRRVRLENYRGFVFGTLNDEAPSLPAYLSDAKAFIDMVVDQAPQGVEILKGRSTYTFDGNWKLQAENGVDGYHVGSVHANYVATMKQRARSKTAGDKTKAMNAGGIPNAAGGYYDLGHGHTMIWSDWSNPEARPLWPRREELALSMGVERAAWTVGRLRNLLLYPNVFLMDQMSSQIRMFRPLAVDKTEVTIYCFAPVGEDGSARAHRIRQYEDFFNASGMATPDDLTEFNECHRGATHHDIIRWSEMSRGSAHEVAGADPHARALGIDPATSGAKIEDEGIFVAQHRRWAELMAPALKDGL
ncbi:Rieske 2Fe-2S domain-containing protein [Panacagrimonas sp.]|uniref:Rieske 2Fe-2S domain-containing protein n=1 Tax=Panacagrimonas sp. TaxID=2480088 RepID=UPI003B517260